MDAWIDYYQILQVHYLAESEVIESAYKKLSKKYHPDVSKESDASEKMKSINHAYDVLSDPIIRKQYFLKWIEKHSGLNSTVKEKTNQNKVVFSYDPTKGLLMEYFNLIAGQKFHLAYDLLSTSDQKNISKNDFVKWQKKVSEVFELKQFDCVVKDLYADITLQNSFYKFLIVFTVKVVELNHVMERIEEDEFTKSIVLENNAWKLYLGYRDLGSMINKFDELAKFKKNKLSERKKTQKQLNIDPISGLLNRRGFTQMALREQIRHNRYGNAFSVILCELNIQDKTVENREFVLKQMGNIIKLELRHLDISSRWKDSRFYLLLPETNKDMAQMVVKKIKAKVDIQFKRDETNDIKLYYVVEEQTGESLNNLFLSLAEQMKHMKSD